MLTFLESFDVVVTVDMLAKPLVAIFCGAVLGWNREAAGRAAGLRTQSLVALGSCIFTMSAFQVALDFPETDVDPVRILAGIVGGIGFLGAGSIVHSGHTIEGVTTAATVWMSGAIGIVCGIGWYEMAVISLVLTIGTLIGLDRLAHVLAPKRKSRVITAEDRPTPLP